ncbi:MAG: C40 family peptidase [Anaerolineae bacterium]|nr:C40 family peptidase [Anaerolineae bacterium]
MKALILGVILGDLITAAVRIVASLVLAVLLALAFAVSSLAALFSAPAAPTPSALRTPLPASGVGSNVVALAYTQLGMPYVWGGASPQTSFDCSGLVQWAYGQVGVRLPRTAQMQYNATERVAPADLQVGDLLFFEHTYPGERITHVGIYVGGGRMINAPTTGDVVREMPVFDDPYWRAHYAGAGRVRR